MTTIQCKCHFCGKPLIRKSAPSIKSVFHFCNNKCKGEYQRTFKPVTKEWLYEQYITNGIDTTQIAHLVKRDPKSVWTWLKDFGIPTRGRGYGRPANWIKKGDKLFGGHKHTVKTRRKQSKIAKSQNRVPYDPVIGSYMKGKKGAATPNWKGGITPERQSFYQTQEWKEAVKAVWKRDNAKCQRCGKHHNTTKSRGTFAIHHIVGFQVKELRAVVSNLVLLCRKCHLFVHSRKNTQKEFLK